jgi:hypothetical protein
LPLLRHKLKFQSSYHCYWEELVSRHQQARGYFSIGVYPVALLAVAVGLAEDVFWAYQFGLLVVVLLVDLYSGALARC